MDRVSGTCFLDTTKSLILELGVKLFRHLTLNKIIPFYHLTSFLSAFSEQLKRFLPCIALFFILNTAILAHASPNMGGTTQDNPDKPWHIAADEISYDQKLDQYIANGHVTITKETKRMSADFVRFVHKSMTAYASGHVVMTAGDDVLTGASLEMNLANETGTLYEGTIFIKENHFYIRGDKLQKIGDKSYSADAASVSSCDGDAPDWKITGKNMTVTIEGYGTIQDAALWAKQVPVMYSPYMVFPALVNRQSGFLIPETGYSQRNGLDFSQPFYWAINDQSDATAFLEYIANRGDRMGAEYRYILDPESKGVIMLDYLSDRQVDNGTPSSTANWGYTGDNVDRPNTDRYWFRMKDDQSLPFGFTAKLDLDIVSDQDYLREFEGNYMGFAESNMAFSKAFGRSLDDYNDTVRTNQLTISKYWPGYSLNTQVLWYDDIIARETGTPDTNIQSLPSVEFFGSQKYLYQTPLMFDTDMQATDFYSKDGERGQRMDLYPRLYYPWQYQQYFTIEPSVGVRETAWYAENNQNGTVDTSPFMNRSMYDVRLDCSSELYNVYQIDGDKIDRIKHIIMPQISYSYIPDYNQSSLPYFDNIDRIQQQNLVTFSLTNTFISKSKPPEDAADRSPESPPPYSYNEFLRFLIEQSYGVDQSVQPQPAGSVFPLYSEIQFQPYKFLELQADAEWSYNDTSFISKNIGAMVSDSRADRIFVEYRNEAGNTESVYTNVLLSLTEQLKAYTDFEQDIQDGQRIETGFGIRYQSQCWALDVRYVDELADQQYLFQISLSGLGGLGSGVQGINDLGGRNSVFEAPYQIIPTSRN